MVDLSDYDLQTDDGLPPPRETRSRPWWLVAGIGLIVVAGAAWLLVSSRRPQPEVTAAPPGPAPAAAARPLGADAAAIDLPPLDQTDALVRTLVRALSSNATIAAWLATGGLIRGFVVAVDNIARGVTPAPRFRALRPPGPFRVLTRGDALAIDPRSYERYTPLAVAVDSLDARGTARLYATLKPRIQDAYAELGQTEGFDVALERALVAMLQTPPLDGDVPLVPKGPVLYAYGNPRLERLTAAQKQLARMGPRNTRMIQDTLRRIAAALGIPGERLP